MIGTQPEMSAFRGGTTAPERVRIVARQSIPLSLQVRFPARSLQIGPGGPEIPGDATVLKKMCPKENVA
jgi:hypothetical protein